MCSAARATSPSQAARPARPSRTLPGRDATRRDRQGERTKGGDRDGDDQQAADDPEPVPPPGPTTEVPTPTPVPPGYERGDETADGAADPDAPERTAWESEPAADEETTTDGR